MAKYVMEVKEDPKCSDDGVLEVDFEAQDDQEAEERADVLAGPGEIVCLFKFDPETRRWVSV